MKCQNIGRTLYSNIVHHFINFLRKRYASYEVIKKIINLHNLNIDIEEFYKLVNEIEFKNYIKSDVMDNIWRGKFDSQI